MIKEADKAWEARQKAFKEFDNEVFNILTHALVTNNMTQALFDQLELDIQGAISPNAKREMLRYTDKIEVFVTGNQQKNGWWWSKNRPVYKHLTAEITFDPYRTRLSVWTTANGVVQFEG